MTTAFLVPVGGVMPRQRHPVALAAVVVAHLLLAVWAWQAHWVDTPSTSPDRLSRLTMLLPPAVVSPPTPGSPDERRRPATTKTPPSSTPQVHPDAGAAVIAAPTIARPNGEAITPEPPASAPLDLAFRPGKGNGANPLNPAVNDPRVTGRMSYGERFAKTLGTDDTVHEETIAGGHRFRQGTSCTEVHDSRGAALDPYNQSYLPTPKGSQSCN